MSYLNEIIKGARESKRYTQKEVADFLEISTRMYQRYEKDVEPGLDVIKRLSEFFGVDLLANNPFPPNDPLNWERAKIIALERRLALVMSLFYETQGKKRTYEECLDDIDNDTEMILADLRRSGRKG